MSGTREKILATSLKLFNEKGSDSISIRDIATTLSISPGNLTYHFKNTDEIIRALYFELVEKANSLFIGMQVETINLTFLLESTNKTFRLIEAYKFLFLDIVRIMRRFPDIHKNYEELMKIRKFQLQFTIQLLAKNGYLENRILNDEFANYEDICFILGDFWLSSAELLFSGTSDAKLKRYLDLTSYPFKPFLTEKGKEQYNAYFEKQY